MKMQKFENKYLKDKKNLERKKIENLEINVIIQENIEMLHIAHVI